LKKIAVEADFGLPRRRDSWPYWRLLVRAGWLGTSGQLTPSTNGDIGENEVHNCQNGRASGILANSATWDTFSGSGVFFAKEKQ